MSKQILKLSKPKFIAGITVMMLSICAAFGTTVAWHMAISKASLTGRGGTIRKTTAMELGLRYFTGNGTLGGSYQGYDSSSIDGKDINFEDDTGSATDLYFAEISSSSDITNAFDFSQMRPGKYYSFAFEETGKDELSITLSAFSPSHSASAPYLEMYTGPLAIANNITMNTESWLTIRDTSLDNIANSDSAYNFMGWARRKTTDANETLSSDVAQVTSGSNAHQQGSFKKASASNGTFDFVLFGDMTVGVYASDQTTYVASTTAASTYKLYGYSNPQGMTTSTGANESSSSFYYVDDATIAAWNSSNLHTKYVSSASAVVGYSRGYTTSNTDSTNDGYAAAYIADTLNNGNGLKDKIDFRFDADIADGLASSSAATSGESTSTYDLGTTESDGLGTSQIVFVTFGFTDDDSARLKVICKRGDNSSEKIYYAYHPNGSFEPYYGLDAGLGNITLE